MVQSSSDQIMLVFSQTYQRHQGSVTDIARWSIFYDDVLLTLMLFLWNYINSIQDWYFNSVIFLNRQVRVSWIVCFPIHPSVFEIPTSCAVPCEKRVYAYKIVIVSLADVEISCMSQTCYHTHQVFMCIVWMHGCWLIKNSGMIFKSLQNIGCERILSLCMCCFLYLNDMYYFILLVIWMWISDV